MISDAEHLHVPIGYFYALEMSVQILCPFLNHGFSLLLSCEFFMYLFYVNLLLDKWFADIFLQFISWLCVFVAGFLGHAERLVSAC